MKSYLVPIAVAAALIISIIVVRQGAQAQDTSSQSTEKMGAVMGDGDATKTSQPGSAIFVTEIPPGYRDWRLISVAHEEGRLNDIRGILGNEIAINAYRERKLPFPDGAVIARIAWEFTPSEENNNAFLPFLKQGAVQKSFVAGHPTNGVQFMIKDSRKYAATGGWGYGQFNDGKPAGEASMQTCFPCHQAIKSRDFVFTRYAP